MIKENKITKDIGRLSGKLLVFGGVYSNFQALQELQKIAAAHKIVSESIICTGDIVGYCAQPEECIQFVEKWGIHTIAGNVEIQLRESKNDCGCDFEEGGRCDVFSKQWYPFAQNTISETSHAYLQTLPHHLRFQYHDKEVMVVHGSFFYTSEFIFHSTPWHVKEPNFIENKVDVILAGHCGLPFTHKKNDKTWSNAGVIGMPANNGKPHVWYMILNFVDGEATFNHFRFDYDHQTASRLMLNENLPASYAKTLNTGIWDNCDILPEKETLAQGKPITIH